MSRTIWLLPIALLLLISGCSNSRPSELRPSTQGGSDAAGQIEGVFVQGDQGCPYPVEGFDESMLIGTWRAGVDESSDTLVFRENGLYKQVTLVESLGFHGESDWQRWTVSYGSRGIPRLHLEGMRLCVPYDLPSCESVGGGESSWWDFCEDQIVTMPDGGILLAVGVPDGLIAPPRGFSLVPLARDPDSGGFSYQFDH